MAGAWAAEVDGGDALGEASCRATLAALSLAGVASTLTVISLPFPLRAGFSPAPLLPDDEPLALARAMTYKIAAATTSTIQIDMCLFLFSFLKILCMPCGL